MPRHHDLNRSDDNACFRTSTKRDSPQPSAESRNPRILPTCADDASFLVSELSACLWPRKTAVTGDRDHEKRTRTEGGIAVDSIALLELDG